MIKMTTRLIVTICFSAALTTSVLAVNYTGYRLVRVIPTAVDELNWLRQLEGRWPSFDFWRGPFKVNVPVDVFIGPSDFDELHQLVSAALTTEMRVLVPDVQSLIESSRREGGLNRADSWTETFHSFEEITSYLDLLTSSNNLIRTSVIGTTFYNESIQMVTISPDFDSTEKREAIYLECCMHAREWISTSTCLFIINELVSKYGTDPEITSLMDNFDWLITPVSNPDGYKYSWTDDRLWRKNRRPNGNSTCVGVDSNRNFDANFGGVGSTSNPCSQTYAGAAAFSEAESIAMRDVLSSGRFDFKASVSVHSNAQLWISPHGYTTDPPADYAEMERVMKAGVEAMSTAYGTQYPYGPGSEVLYLTSGTTKDYVYDRLGIVHGYTLELRNSDLGFVPPASDIIPVATEAWNGLKAMAKELIQ